MKKRFITMTFSLNESDPVTHLLCNFHQLSFAQSRDIAKKSIIWVSRIIRQTRGIVITIGIFFKISTICALNMWLVAFARKLYQICKHRYNNLLVINLIHLHSNNMGFTKNHPFKASPVAEASDIIKNVTVLAT